MYQNHFQYNQNPYALKPFQQSPSQNYQFNGCSGQAKKCIDNYSYMLSDQIGKGFSSKVFKGKNDLTQEQVAIKVIDRSALKTAFHHQLLKSEIEALSLLDSSFIMKLYKVVETANNTYLVTEFCEGGDLNSRITKSGAQPEALVQQLMQGIVQGYSIMKSKGIVHRDLKPANILLSKNSTPKISDFGFAITQNTSKTMPNINVGSPLYMSPQALKMSRFSDKSDIWAIGVTAFELLYGQVPWSACSEAELANKMFSNQVKFPQNIIVSHQCQDFIKRCLTVDEQLRITVEEMKMHSWIASKLVKPLGERINVDWIKQTEQNQQFTQQQLHPSQKRLDNYGTKTPVENTSNKEKENQGFSTEQFIQKETRNFSIMQQNPNTNERQENDQYKKNDYIILSQINFCRFLMKIYSLLENVNLFHSVFLREKIQFFVIKNIMLKMSKLKDLVFKANIPPLNTMDLKNFIPYSQTSTFIKLGTVITEYYTKYSASFSALWIILQPTEIKSQLQTDKKFDAVFDQNQTEFESFYIILQSSLRVAVRELEKGLEGMIGFNSTSTEEELPKNIETNVILLDYLVTYFQLTALILDEFNQHEQFAEKSKIELIADGQPVRLSFGHYLEIKNKIHQLEI